MKKMERYFFLDAKKTLSVYPINEKLAKKWLTELKQWLKFNQFEKQPDTDIKRGHAKALADYLGANRWGIY